MSIIKNEILKDIHYIENIISDFQNKIILEELNFSHWQPSTILKKDYSNGNYYHEINDFRISETSHQQWFSDILNREIALIEKQIKSFFNVSSEYLEPWQALKYPKFGKVDYHLDAGYWHGDVGGERILTFLIYLTTPVIGGETHFRAHNLKIPAVARNMLAWNNLLPNGFANHRMIHSGMPVQEGDKICLITWSRQNKYKTINYDR